MSPTIPHSNERLDLLRIDMAVVQRDFKEIDRRLTSIEGDIAKIKGYFIKALFGAGAVVGLSIFKWIVAGGLSGGA